MARIHIIGAGTPTPTPARFGSSFVVEVAGEQLMVDCGPATTYKMVRAGLWPPDVDYLFFTHHHFDHDVDYPCFLLTRWDQGTDKAGPLQVFGPGPTERLTEGILGEDGLWNQDWKSRVRHPVGQKVYENRGRQAAPKAAGSDGEGRRAGPCLLLAGLAGHSGRRRARPALHGLAGLPARDPGRNHRLHRRHQAMRHGAGAGHGRGRAVMHVLG